MSTDPAPLHDATAPDEAALQAGPESTEDSAAVPEPSARRVLLSSALALVALMAIVTALGTWLRGPLVAASRTFVEVAGGPGIALGFFVPDAFTLPIPSDAFSTVGIAGGMAFWHVVVWGSAGSIAGGCTGWFIGRRLRRTRRLDRFASGRGAQLERLVRQHGAWLIAFAAVSPLPYSLTAWVAGASRMPLTVFAAVSVLRVVRVTIPLYLIELGLLTFSG
jgi:membrane protein YqaA with SNARE-associated domain